MKTNRFSDIKNAITICLIFGCVAYLVSCTTSPATKPGEATYQKGGGKLVTNEGRQFYYRFYPAEQKGPSVIYIPGLSGNPDSNNTNGVYALSALFNKDNFNFIGFNRGDRAGTTSSQKAKIKILQARGKSGSIMMPSVDGKESSAENIVRNEILAVIEYIEKAPTHDLEKGIYLIGGSYGSWVSLVTVSSFSDKIKGVVFLSPAILPEWVSPDAQAKRPTLNITSYFRSLTQKYGERPALAIGSKSDIIAPNISKDGSALDGVELLRNQIGSNVEVMEVSSSLHSFYLVAGSQKVRKKIVQWLNECVEKQ